MGFLKAPYQLRSCSSPIYTLDNYCNNQGPFFHRSNENLGDQDLSPSGNFYLIHLEDLFFCHFGVLDTNRLLAFAIYFCPVFKAKKTRIFRFITNLGSPNKPANLQGLPNGSKSVYVSGFLDHPNCSDQKKTFPSIFAPASSTFLLKLLFFSFLKILLICEVSKSRRNSMSSF